MKTENCNMHGQKIAPYMCEWPVSGTDSICGAQLCELHVRKADVEGIGPVWLCVRHAGEFERGMK